jgi:hypothetical protein
MTSLDTILCPANTLPTSRDKHLEVPTPKRLSITTILNWPSLRDICSTETPAPLPLTSQRAEVFGAGLRHTTNSAIVEGHEGKSFEFEMPRPLGKQAFAAGKRALEADDVGAPGAQIQGAMKRVKMHDKHLHFAPAARALDGPDLLSLITSNLIDSTIHRRVFNTASMLMSIKSSINRSGYTLNAKAQDLYSRPSGRKKVESAILSALHKRLQSLIDRIQIAHQENEAALACGNPSYSSLDEVGLVGILPSKVRMGISFIPLLVKLQEAVLEATAHVHIGQQRRGFTHTHTHTKSRRNSEIDAVSTPAVLPMR